MTAYRKNHGFTLVEILIVVIILGILAAIVIPQFTNASTDARRSSVQSMVQTIRSQVELYKLQHNDKLPDLVTDWNPFLQYSNLAGGLSAVKDPVNFPYGPYLQQAPVNQLMAEAVQTTVMDGTAAPADDATAGYVYDYNGGDGSGMFWGVDKLSDGSIALMK